MKKNFFTLTNNAAFGKLWKMLENIEILNLYQQKKEKTISYQTQTIIKLFFFSEKKLTIEMRKTHILMNKQVSYFGLLILDFDYLKLILWLRETKM